MTAWNLLVSKDDLATTRRTDGEAPDAGPGEAVLRVDRVGMTANNVTYAALGEQLRYWEFFPTESGWGQVPVWGFADVVASQVEGVPVGGRYFGYYPTASHLLVRPGAVGTGGFRDVSEHRASLPSPYNGYQLVGADPAYEAEREDLQALYRPLFFTSFMLADFLADNGFFGARTVVFSSASSKTAYGTAFLLEGVHRVGLTSAGNADFTSSLGCYDEVLTYDDVPSLPTEVPTLYADLSGSASLRSAVRAQLGEALVQDCLIGMTHVDEVGSGATSDADHISGPGPHFFFAPDQMAKRRSDWGADGLEQRHGAAWRSFVPHVEQWVDVEVGHGPQDLERVWLEVLGNRAQPRTGHVLQL